MTEGKKVVIVGGGPAALATAFDLSQFDDKYDITLFTMGWRLGGKCASSHNAAQFDRNEEHGLHLPMGFYENFFDQIQRVYELAGRPADCPLPTAATAFRKRNTLTLTERFGENEWVEWPIEFPEKGREPGARARARMAGAELPWMTLTDCVTGILHWLTSYVAELLKGASVPQKIIDDLIKEIDAVLQLGESLALLTTKTLLPVLTAVAYDVVLPGLEPEMDKSAPRKAWIMLELGLATLNGLIDLVNAEQPLASLDGMDFTEWLDSHARDNHLTKWSRNSALLRMVYELVFAYDEGDTKKPRLAAGVALRGLLRLVFDYADTVAFDLAAGMGEVVIEPYFTAIKNANPNARFVFFSRLVSVELSEDKQKIAKLRFAVQATPKQQPYDPLVDLHGLSVWPASPKYAALAEGDQLKQGDELPDGGFDLESHLSAWKNVGTLELDVSNAIVVLAMPPTALVDVTRPLSDASPTWAEMLRRVTGVSTIAMQTWTVSDAEELGWPHTRSRSDESLLVGSYADPLGTIMDMTHVVRFESWPKNESPRGSFYFCGPFKPPPVDGEAGGAYLKSARNAALGLAREWAARNLGFPFPGLVAAAPLDQTQFVAPRLSEGGDRFGCQYFRACVNAGEQYITSFPNTIQARLRPDVTPFRNLLLAGDWTNNGMNAGALEAAVTSGRIAARAIRGKNYAIYGEGDWL